MKTIAIFGMYVGSLVRRYVGDRHTDGEVFFILQYGLSLLGLADMPGAVPPVYS